MKIAMGSDHIGLGLKNEIARTLHDQGHQIIDVGPYTAERADYPIYGAAAAQKVAHGEADRAIVICGSGVGISIAANKVPGARCVLCSEPYSAKMSRAHNNTNVLAMGARVVGADLAQMIVSEWLAGQYEGGRHERRVQQLAALDAGNQQS